MMVQPQRSTTQARQKRVFLHEAHPTIKRLILKRLMQDRELDVIGSSARPLETVKQAARLRPDIIIVGLSLYDQEIPAWIRTLQADQHQMAIVLLDTTFDPVRHHWIRETPHGGYVLKGEPWEVLARAIKTAAEK